RRCGRWRRGAATSPAWAAGWRPSPWSPPRAGPGSGSPSPRRAARRRGVAPPAGPASAGGGGGGGGRRGPGAGAGGGGGRRGAGAGEGTWARVLAPAWAEAAVGTGLLALALAWRAPESRPQSATLAGVAVSALLLAWTLRVTELAWLGSLLLLAAIGHLLLWG